MFTQLNLHRSYNINVMKLSIITIPLKNGMIVISKFSNIKMLTNRINVIRYYG